MVTFADSIFSPIVGLILLAPLFLAFVAWAALKLSPGRRTSWRLATGLVALLSGLALAFMFLTIRGGAPIGLWPVALVPILIGLCSLTAWCRKPTVDELPHARRTSWRLAIGLVALLSGLVLAFMSL